MCTMCHHVLVSCTLSHSIWHVFGCALFWCWVSLRVPITNSLLEFYLIMIVVTIIGILMAIILILNYTLRLSVTKYLWFCKCAHSWKFPPLDIPFAYWIGHLTVKLLWFMFRFSTRIIYRIIPGFVTDCPCGVWCRGLTTHLLYVSPLFRNLD